MQDSFKDRLVALRKENNFTQDKLAESLEVAKSTISMYEKGNRMPSYEMLEKIADFFNVDIDYLMGKSNVKRRISVTPHSVSNNINNGEKLKNRRLELGLTLEQVGDIVGVTKSTVRKWESGIIENMGRDKIPLLANALNVSPEFIIEDNNLNFNDKSLSLKEMQKLEEKRLISEISFILQRNSNCILSEIKRGNKVDVIKDNDIINTYDVELVLKAYELKYLKDKFSLEDIENLSHRFNIPDDLKGISRKQYIKFMGESAMFFDDDSISEETKDKLLLSFQRMFYDAKEKNRRKK